METRQRYIKIKALMGAGGHPSLAYISADLFVLKHWSIRHEKSASSSLGDDGGENPLSTAQIPIKTLWCSGLVTGEAIPVFMKPLFNLFSSAL